MITKIECVVFYDRKIRYMGAYSESWIIGWSPKSQTQLRKDISIYTKLQLTEPTLVDVPIQCWIYFSLVLVQSLDDNLRTEGQLQVSIESIESPWWQES